MTQGAFIRAIAPSVLSLAPASEIGAVVFSLRDARSRQWRTRRPLFGIPRTSSRPSADYFTTKLAMRGETRADSRALGSSTTAATNALDRSKRVSLLTREFPSLVSLSTNRTVVVHGLARFYNRPTRRRLALTCSTRFSLTSRQTERSTDWICSHGTENNEIGESR